MDLHETVLCYALLIKSKVKEHQKLRLPKEQIMDISFHLIYPWYFNVCNLSFHSPNTPWVVFGFGSDDLSGLTSAIDYLSSKPPDILKTQEGTVHYGGLAIIFFCQ